jgi:hypothetical protein
LPNCLLGRYQFHIRENLPLDEDTHNQRYKNLNLMYQTVPEHERFLVIPPITKPLKKKIANGGKNFNAKRKKRRRGGQ